MRKILPILNVIQRVSARFSGGDVVVRSHGAWWAILAGSPGVLRGGVGAVVLVVRRPGGSRFGGAASSRVAPRRPTGPVLAPREDRSVARPASAPQEPRNHAEAAERIRRARANDPPKAPESGPGAG